MYRKLSIKYHPDKNPDEESKRRPKHHNETEACDRTFCERKFGEIRDAYEATHGALGRARDASCTHLHALPA